MNDYQYGQSHPGIRLGELLRKSSFTHEILAQKLSVSTYRLRTLLKGTKAVELELALKLACIFPEHTARDWLDMQTAYDIHQAYRSGQMDAIAREMGAEDRNLSAVDWSMELAKNSGSVKLPLRYPLNHMMDALCEKLGLSKQDVAIEAVKQLWQRIARGDTAND